MVRGIKSTTGKSVFSLSLAVLVMALLASTGALAQQPERESEAWQFGLSIYGWFPNIAGQTSFTPPGGSSEFGIDIDDILDSLEFALMGTFDARKGRWGLRSEKLDMDVNRVLPRT